MASWRTGLRVGLLFGGILVFLDLIGFSTTVTGVWIPLIGLGLWAGVAVVRSTGTADQDWGGVFANLIAAGIGGGVLLAVLVFLIATARAANFDLRVEFFQLSPDVIRDLSFAMSPILAAAANLGAFAASVIVGGLTYFLSQKSGLNARLSGSMTALRNQFTDSAMWRWTGETRIGRIVLFVLLIAIILILPLLIPSILNYYTISSVLIYVLMALGLNIVVGLAGLLDLGYVVFFAIGAYTAALLTAPIPHHLMWNFWIVIPIGVLLAAGVGVLLGIPVLRLRGDYLAIVTLGFGEVIRVLMKSDALTSFSNGPKGVAAIGQPMIFGRPFNDPFAFVVLSGIGAAFVIFLTSRLQHSRVGRAWVAIREDETVARAMGINTLFYKLLAFGIGASFAGIGGLLYASRNQFTGPEDHTLLVSINILSIVIVGGMGSVPGVILGAFVLKGIPEILRVLENYRILIFATLLIAMMIFRPQGLWPSARRRLEMHIEEEVPIDEAESEPSKGTAK